MVFVESVAPYPSSIRNRDNLLLFMKLLEKKNDWSAPVKDLASQ